MSELPSIDVFIATMGSRQLVLSCLEHLERQRVPHQVYLADNAGNTDGTSDAVRERYPHVHVVTFDQNVGFGGAIRHLASLGTGEIIVMANDDMDVEPQFLAELVAPFRDPCVGMVAGLTLQPGADTVVDAYGIEVDPTLQAYNRLRHRSPDAVPGVLLGPSGGAAAYRRIAWEAAGGFEPRLFMYCEDLDLALRLRLAGWDTAQAPRARGVHLGGATAVVGSPFMRWHGGFGRGFILRRYGVMRTRHAPRALLVELLTVLKGLFFSHSLVPLTARVDGWRAAGHGPRLRIPWEGVDSRITLRTALHRMIHER